jgi:hypothetical protein
MQVLVAITTARPHRGRRSQLDAALDGELVRPPVPGCGDPGCDCDQVWVGVVSGQAAPAVMVVELSIQRAGLVAAFTDALANQGRLHPDDDDDAAWVADLVDQHLELARAHPLATVIDLGRGEPAIRLQRAS